MFILIFVEGYHDFHFFSQLFLKLKNFSKGKIEGNSDLAVLYNFFKNTPNRAILQDNKNFVLIIQGNGKKYAIMTFLYTIEQLIKIQNSAEKVLLIIDKDMDPNPEKKILQILMNLKEKIRRLKITTIKPYKNLHKLKIERYPQKTETGIIDIKPNLEQIFRDFLKNYSVIPNVLCKESDPDRVIKNAIDHFGLKNFEELSKHIFENKNKEIKTELTRICLLDTICNFI